MQKNLFCLLLALCANGLFAQNQAPIISQLSVNADLVAKTLSITYDVSDAENDPLEISLAFSGNGGRTYQLGNLVGSTTGDIGFPVQPGNGKTIVCDISNLSTSNGTCHVRLVADDKQIFDLQALVNEVDSTRLRADLEVVEGVRHRSGNPTHLQATRDLLLNHYAGLGLFTEQQSFTYTNSTGKNILASLPGTVSAEKVVIVDAHYDTVFDSPGADDNGSGTIGVMEAARLLSRFPHKKSLRFIGFDLEEAGLVGSIRYVQSGIPAGEQIEGVFNFEMIGFYSEAPFSQELPVGFDLLFPDAFAAVVNNQYRGDFLSNVGNATSQSLITLFNSSAATYVPDLKVIPLTVPGNGQIAPDLRRSDHAPFWEANKKALMLTDGANFRNHCYHTTADTLDGKLNFTFLSNVVKATVAAAAQLAEIQHADWAQASFSVPTVGTQTAPDCDWKIIAAAGADHRIYIETQNCPSEEAHIEVFDEKGTLLSGETAVLPSAGRYLVFLGQQLPAGAYFVRVSTGRGSRMQKVLLGK